MKKPKKQNGLNPVEYRTQTIYPLFYFIVPLTGYWSFRKFFI